jgi:dihydroorotate dehydrogenase
MSLLYERILRPILFKLEAERAHRIAAFSMRILGKASMLRHLTSIYCRSESSPIRLFGLDFPNPIGLAAGMDKNGAFIQSAFALGFGHVEIGTVTPQQQLGNSKPRLFRYPQVGGIVNRMGFNNDGAEIIAERVKRNYPREKRYAPLGINIGKAKTTNLDRAADDYISCFKIVANQADYIAINISSPNTRSLRTLQKPDRLAPLLHALNQERKNFSVKMVQRRVPVLLKISPDESFRALDIVLELAFRYEIDGIIATNSTIGRVESDSECCTESGGLSGLPLRKRSTEVVRYLAKASGGRIPIIGVGGICDAISAGEKLDAGASLIQLYSGFVYKGPLLVKSLARSMIHRHSNFVKGNR